MPAENFFARLEMNQMVWVLPQIISRSPAEPVTGGACRKLTCFSGGILAQGIGYVEEARSQFIGKENMGSL